MSDLLHPRTLTVVRVSYGSPDADGVPAVTSDPVEVSGWNIQPAGSAEDRAAGEVTTTRLRASGPLTQWIGPGERVEIGGVAYRVEGEPAHYTTGIRDHTELTLIRWEGV